MFRAMRRIRQQISDEECSSIFYKADIINDLKADYLESQSVSRERFADDIKSGIFHRLLDSVLRVAAPLL